MLSAVASGRASWESGRGVRYQLSSMPITYEPVPIPPFCKRLLLSIRFSGSERRSSVRTCRETLEERLELYPQKCVGSSYTLERTCRGYRKSLRLFCGYSSRRFSSVSSLLLQELKSPYDFLNFNGDFTTIETARKRSVKRLSNAQARCQRWSLRWSTTIVSFVAGACGAEEHG